MLEDDYIFIKDINYIVQKYMLNTYALVFLTNKKYIKKILLKHRKSKTKQQRIKEELKALSVIL
jgi:hypothetical protein